MRLVITANVIEATAAGLMICWLAAVTAELVREQIALLPLTDPTAAQISFARPKAAMDFANVMLRLSSRIPDPQPPEFGAVWTTRQGRVCGLVNNRRDGIDNMTPFYSLNGAAMLRDDNARLFFTYWRECKLSQWVTLHQGTLKTGFCATRRHEDKWLGWVRCSDWLRFGHDA